jgi:hypothetical protein
LLRRIPSEVVGRDEEADGFGFCSQETAPSFQTPAISAWLARFSLLDNFRDVNGDSAGWWKKMASTGEGGAAFGETPMFLRISWLGAVAISTSMADMGAGGELPFGTSLSIVPWGVLGSE